MTQTVTETTQPWYLIANHLELNGQKQSWLASQTGISNTQLHFILKGERPLSDKNRELINAVLGTDY